MLTTHYIGPLLDRLDAGTTANLTDADLWLDADTRSAVLSEAGRFSETVLGPLNKVGDQTGATLSDQKVATSPGFLSAYEQFCAQGWAQAGLPEAFGGQALPMTTMVALHEMFNGANAAFSLLPMLNFGAAVTIDSVASEEIKSRYLPDLIAGKTSAAMVMTESDAGSDMSTIKTTARLDENGDYRVFGQKQFITYGDHDLTENILHLTLVRTSHQGGGLRGLSLLLVPKRLPDGTRNAWRCSSIEHKLGIRASPTATIVYGDGEVGALGYLLGKAGRGLEYFYLMMRLARLFVAAQAVGLSAASCQEAMRYARFRRQGSLAGSREPMPIIDHPDVRRMLATMTATTRAMRAGVYRAAAALDRAAGWPEGEGRRFEAALADLMIPALKAFCTDSAVEIASTAMQVHGGIGYVEESRAAQYYRDARIGPIYEGANGIQAIEVAIRRVGRDRGAIVYRLIDRIRRTLSDGACGASSDEFVRQLALSVDALSIATDWAVTRFESDIDTLRYGAVDYATLLSIVFCGWQLALQTEQTGQALCDRRHYRDDMLLRAEWLTAKLASSDKRWEACASLPAFEAAANWRIGP